jgi:hypothetical protein
VREAVTETHVEFRGRGLFLLLFLVLLLRLARRDLLLLLRRGPAAPCLPAPRPPEVAPACRLPPPAAVRIVFRLPVATHAIAFLEVHHRVEANGHERFTSASAAFTSLSAST